MSDQKPEQPDWEVVDTAAPQPPPKATRSAMMRAILGPWWRWKIAAGVLVFCAVLALVFALAGIFFVVGLAVVLLTMAVAKVKQLLRNKDNSVTR